MDSQPNVSTAAQTPNQSSAQMGLDSEYIVDIIEATVRVLVSTGLTREQALQVMLSQIAVQLPPEIMRVGVDVSEKYAKAFFDTDWDAENLSQRSEKCGRTENPKSYL